MPRFLKILFHNWFLILLVGVMVTGMAGSPSLVWLTDARWINISVVMITMFVMALPLDLSDITSAARRPAPVALAFAVNLVLVPLAAWPLARLLGGELGPGLIVLAATPSTLASAAVWTRRAGGNDLVAIMNTVLTNSTCFAVLPAWVWLLAGTTSSGQSFLATASQLLLLVVFPMVAAQITRAAAPKIGKWASGSKSLLGVTAQAGILIMVLIGAVESGKSFSGSMAIPESTTLALMMAVLAGLHTFTWLAGYWLGQLLGFGHRDAIGIAFSGSQKTLMIGLSTALSLEVSILPLVSYHILQLIIGTMIADWCIASSKRAAKSTR